MELLHKNKHMSQDSTLLIAPTQFVESKFSEFKKRKNYDEIGYTYRLPIEDE